MVVHKKAHETESRTRLRLWVKLLRLTRATESALRERLRSEFSSTLPRFDVMAALYPKPEGIKMSELSAALLVSNGNATVIVDRLVSEGLVERQVVPEDRRALLVKLTDQGVVDFEEHAKKHEAWVNELLSDISVDRAQAIIDIVDQDVLQRGKAKN